MGLNLNLSKIKGPVDEQKNTAFKETPPGRGMALVKEFREYGHAKTGAHELVLELVAWSNPEGVGIEHTELLFPSKPDAEEDYLTAKLLKIALATGLITPREAEAARSGAGELDIDFATALPGRPLLIEVVKRKDKDGTREFANIGEGGFAFYHCRDPRCKDWPKHAVLVNQNGAAIGEWEPLKKDAPPATSSKPSGNPFAGKA